MQQKKLKIVLFLTTFAIINQAHAGLPDALAKHYPSVTIQEDQIQLRAPHLAEEGKVVPIKIGSVHLPDKNVHITEVSFYSENNTTCPLSKYQLSPRMLGEGLGTHVKLPSTTTVHAIATLSNGDVISGSRKIKVTIGGCGGGSVIPSGASAGDYCLNKKTITQ